MKSQRRREQLRMVNLSLQLWERCVFISRVWQETSCLQQMLQPWGGWEESGRGRGTARRASWTRVGSHGTEETVGCSCLEI